MKQLKKPLFQLAPAFALLLLLTTSACKEKLSEVPKLDFRAEMREFVQDISVYGKTADSDFIIIPQNGHELVLEDGKIASAYVSAIDGLGREDLFWGYDNDNVPTPQNVQAETFPFLDSALAAGKPILVTDYCDASNRQAAIQANNSRGYLSFPAPERELHVIPTQTPQNENANDIPTLNDAQNFLYLISPENYATKTDFINAVTQTNYDVLIMDAYLNESLFTANEVDALRHKANGGKRLVISYMSIGEAESYRPYWKSSWRVGNPDWLDRENPDWEGNYKVRYWDEEWQAVIFGSQDAYLDQLLESGFDGVYLDIIDAYEYFEEQ